MKGGIRFRMAIRLGGPHRTLAKSNCPRWHQPRRPSVGNSECGAILIDTGGVPVRMLSQAESVPWIDSPPAQRI
jgi:hypothetical protein